MVAERAAVGAARGPVGDETGRDDPIDILAEADEGDRDHALARQSGDAEQMLEARRQYLLMIANDVIGPELQAKLGPSDLVQDTFLEAQRHIDAFRGRTEAELRAWLRKILECRLANARRTYLATEKRAAVREVTLETLLASRDATAEFLASSSLSPSSHAVRKGWAQLPAEALARLPDNYRNVVTWRHQEQLAWDEIGQRLGCSADAARKVWSRAIHHLRRDLARHGFVP
jgi:RNA polymerase sigma-70 factor (ECF subfamily)